jgi:hypothetical protein
MKKENSSEVVLVYSTPTHAQHMDPKGCNSKDKPFKNEPNAQDLSKR